ncbi:MAG: GFA family protein [Dongiaceae bacterium]
MTETSRSVRGGCMCGNVRFEAKGNPIWIGICHCASCRRATGGALVAACGYSRDAVSIAGESLRHFVSSPGVRRGFCAGCGTSLSYENQRWPSDIHLMLGAFDEPDRLVPEFHIFAADRLPWLRLVDTLPRYRTTPSAGERISGDAALL